MWRKYGRARQATDKNIIGRIRFAYCITKVTHIYPHIHTHSVIILVFFMVAIVLRTRLSVTFIRKLHVLFRNPTAIISSTTKISLVR